LGGANEEGELDFKRKRESDSPAKFPDSGIERAHRYPLLPQVVSSNPHSIRILPESCAIGVLIGYMGY